MKSEIHISLAAEEIGKIGPLPITNTLLISWILMLLLVAISFYLKSRLNRRPDKLQAAAELFIGGLYSLFGAVTGKYTSTFFPLMATIFIFVLAANWVELIPGMHSIKLAVEHNHHLEHVPILRAPSTDLNFTLAIAIVSVFFVQWYGVKNLGLSYFSKFINLKGPADFFVGILEIISEFAKIVSFAFRLFGNIFAGEVLLTVVAFLVPLIAPIPFLGLELFVGLIQAVVFSMLTAVFLNVATTAHH